MRKSACPARAELGACRAVAVGLQRRARPFQLADLSAEFCPTRALFLARMSVGDARVYTCTCTVHDKLSCTRLQNYTIGASLKSVSVTVSVPWNLSFTHLEAALDADGVDHDVFDIRRDAGLLGDQLDGFHVGIQHQFGVVPSSDVLLVGVLECVGELELGSAGRRRVDDELDARRRDLVDERQAPATSGHRHWHLKHRVTRRRPERRFQIVDWTITTQTYTHTHTHTLAQLSLDWLE